MHVIAAIFGIHFRTVNKTVFNFLAKFVHIHLFYKMDMLDYQNSKDRLDEVACGFCHKAGGVFQGIIGLIDRSQEKKKLKWA